MSSATHARHHSPMYLSVVAIVVLGFLTIGDFARVLPTAGLSSVSCTPNARALVEDQVTLSDQVATTSPSSSVIMSVHTSLARVPAGLVTFVATNAGSLIHDLVVLPMPPGGPSALFVGPNGMVDESTSVGSASLSCGEGSGTGILPGASSWVTASLHRGQYLLLSNQPWQFEAGMYTTLTVA